MVKLIGADMSSAGNVANAVKLPTTNVQELTPTTGFQFAGQQLQQGIQGGLSSIQNQARMTSAMAQDNAQTTENTRVSQQTILQANAANAKQGLEGLASVGNMIVKTLDDVAKRKAAQRKAEQDFNAASLDERIAKMEVDAPGRARTDPSGITGLSTEFEKLMSNQDISQEHRTKSFQKFYGGILAPLQNKNIEDVVTEDRKVRDVLAETAATNVTTTAASLLSAIGSAETDDKRNEFIQRLQTEVLLPVTTKGGFGRMAIARVQSAVATALSKSVFTSVEGEEQTRAQAANINEYLTGAVSINEQYASDPVAAKRALAVLATKLKMSGPITEMYQPDAPGKVLREIEQNRQTDEGLIEKREAKFYSRVQLAPLEIGKILTTLLTKDDLEGAIRTNVALYADGKETPGGIQLRAAFNEREQYEEGERKLGLSRDQLGLRKAEVATQAVTDNIAFLKSNKPEQQARGLEMLQGLPGMSQQYQSLLSQGAQYSQMDAGQKAAYDEQMSAMYGDLVKAREGQIAALDAVYDGENQNQNDLRTKMLYYGFQSKGGRTVFDEGAYSVHVAKVKAEAAARKPAPGVAGTPSSFSRVGMSTMTSPISGKQVYIPFKKGTESQGTSRFGPREAPVPGASTMHGGTDIWAKTGTPIIAAMMGKVTYNADYGGGGNGVEVTYQDGSVHTFMHLNRRSPLAVGQTVQPGQVVGEVGSTGRVSAEHLHWEVSVGGVKQDPYIWAEKYTSQPQQGSTVTKQQYSSPETSYGSRDQAPTGSIPIMGGYITGTGKNLKIVRYADQTREATEARSSVNAPSLVEPNKANRVLVQRTGTMDDKGLEKLMVTLYDKTGTPVGQYQTNSGDPTMQGTFGAGGTTVTGSRSPLEYGSYKIGATSDESHQPGMRSNFIEINPQFDTQRSLLGIHFDGDRAIRPGSAGCLVFPDKAKFDEFHKKLRNNGLSTLEFSPVKYSNAAPLRATSNSQRATDTPQGDDLDHGYKVLKEQPEFRRKLNKVARELGFPGQWLADAMSGESGFAANIKQRGGHPAVGLIQFYQDPGTPGYKTINGRKYSLAEIGGMSPVRQLDVVKDYFIEGQRNAGGKITTPKDVLGIIWANELDRNIEHGRSDGDITWGEYRQTLGRNVGRKYSAAPTRDVNQNIASTQRSDRTNRIVASVDTRPKSGCTLCTQMVAYNQFVPHERVNNLNKGSELFTYNLG